MGLTERQRELLNVTGFVIPGNVYKIHYTILKFGHAESPTHFTTNVTEKLLNIGAVTVIPISTKRYSTNNIVPLNLSKDSNLKPYEDENLNLQSYAIIRLPKQVELEQLFQEPGTHLRGALLDDKIEEVLKARREYIRFQFSRKGRP